MARANSITNIVDYVVIILLTFGCFRECSGHGRLLEPPGRSSMWRYPEQFPNASANYQDHELNCGGRWYQHESVGGKCGVCGDKFIPGSNAPRPNEAGGRYANGVITRHYKRNDVITVTVEVTASHKGYFEFRICPVNDITEAATHECLNANLLRLVDGSDRFYYGSTAGRYYPTVQLPQDLTCSQCVFQWRWRTGNNWGYDESGGCLGCGPQEEFYGCSDIRIEDDDTHQSTEGIADAGKHVTTTRVQTTLGQVQTTLGQVQTTLGYVTKEPTTASNAVEEATTPSHTTKEATTASHVTQTQTTVTSHHVTSMTTTERSGLFQAVGIWKSVAGMNKWCNANCAAGYCPRGYCRRVGINPTTVRRPICKSTGAWSGAVGMDTWCQTNCDMNFCPASHCLCN